MLQAEKPKEFRAARADLARMLQAGATYTEIGRHYGRSPEAASHACRGLGLPQPKTARRAIPSVDALASARADVERMLLAGATYSEIARHYRFSVTTIAETCRRLGLPDRREPLPVARAADRLEGAPAHMDRHQHQQEKEARRMTWHPEDNYDARALAREEVLDLLRAAVAEAGTQPAFAREHGLNAGDLSTALSGRKDPTAAVLKALGVSKGYVREAR